MQRIAWTVGSVVASAILLVLALPPADVYYLGFIALIPVFLAVRGRGFAVGFASGMGVLVLGSFITRWGWFYEKSLVDGDPAWNHLGFALFGIAVGMTCALVGECKRVDKWTPWLIAAWAVLFEACLLVYLPAHLGLTQYRVFPAMKLASIFGIWGVSYFVWVINLQLMIAVQKKKNTTLAVCGVVLGLYLGMGAMLGNPRLGEMTVAAVQDDTMFLDDLAEWNREATDRGATIVVWPELSATTAAPRGETERLVEIAQQDDQAPFITTFKDAASPKPHNVAALFSKDGELVRYNKRKPFGGERNKVTAGSEPAAATVGGVTYGLNICFDSCFPSVMRDTASLDDVEVILLPTLDPIAPFGTMQAIHAAYTPFRAAELGIPIIRADITAYSMIVDARGVIVAEAGSGTKEVLIGTITPDSRNTIYRRFGDWFLYLCGLAAIAGIVAGRRKKPQPGESNARTVE
ncbi:MAG: hypothetical protein IH944_10590 [Armatimonadetes bacterium]|nr:hypothetical protein [Armatimonadota bacterium]